METRANLIKIGVFVLAVILAGFGGAFWLLKGDQKGPRSTVAVVFQGSVGGLLQGAAVSYNGIKVGEVSKVQFDDADPGHVMVNLSVDSNAPIRKDSVVALGFSGLTGYATVQITGGSAGSPRLLDQKGGIPELNADASSMQDLMGGARTIMGRANETLTTVNRLVTESAPSITKIIKNVETVSDSLAANSQNIDKFLKSVGDASETLTNVSGRIDKLVIDIDNVATAVDHDKVARILTNVAQISDEIAKSSTNLQDMANDVHATISDARKVMAAIDPAKISATIESISKVSQYLSTKTSDFDDVLTHARAATANIDTISATVAQKSPEISQFITDAQSAMQQIELASHRLDGVLAKVDGIVGSDAGQGLFAQGRTFLIQATDSAKSIGDAANAFKDTSQIYGAKANDITTAVKDFVADARKTLSTVDHAVSNFDRNPQQLIFGSKSNVPEYGPGRK